jgi:type IV secretion system protein VirB1
MPLAPAIILSLAATCAPSVAPPTLLAVARVESGLDPLAIGVNGEATRRPRAGTSTEAIREAEALIAGGHDVDLGLGQINVRNLPRVGLTIADAFDPCRNLEASARILAEGYARSLPAKGAGQAALRTALSIYNTGGPDGGFRNGYVARVLASARGDIEARPAPVDPSLPASIAAWDVFGRARLGRHGFVLRPNPGVQP